MNIKICALLFSLPLSMPAESCFSEHLLPTNSPDRACLYELTQSNIKEITSIKDALHEFESTTKDSLIVVDLDQTVFNPAENFFYLLYRPIENFSPEDQPFIQKLINSSPPLSEARKNFCNQPELVSAVFSKTKFVPVEKKFIEIIKEQQKKGVKVIALTSIDAGKFGEIERLEEWRTQNLRDVELDFHDTAQQEEVPAEALTPPGSPTAAFYRGVLCASQNSKGIMLKKLLHAVKWHPDKIIFLDDSKNQCESVAKEMEKEGIPTTSFWYCATRDKKIKLNTKQITAQLDYWLAHKKFLNTEELQASL